MAAAGWGEGGACFVVRGGWCSSRGVGGSGADWGAGRVRGVREVGIGRRAGVGRSEVPGVISGVGVTPLVARLGLGGRAPGREVR